VAKDTAFQHHDPKWPVRLAAAGIFLTEVVVLAGSASPFRLPKEAVILSTICLAVGMAVVAAARRRVVKIPTGPMVVVLLALPILQAVSALWSASPRRALESACLTSIWVVGIFWMATLSADTRRRLALAAAVGVAVSAAVMIIQLAGENVFNFTARFSTHRLRLTGLTGNPSDLAMAAVLLLPFVLSWGENSTRPRLYRGVAVVLTLGAMASQTLTGLAALSFMLLIWLIQKRSKTLWLTTLGVGAALVAVALATGLATRLQVEVNRVRRGDYYQLFSARGDGWSAGLEMIRSRPVRGVGAANYTHLYYPSRLEWLTRKGGTGRRGELASHFQWAHSDPLQQTAELGVLGIGWMIALATAVYRTRKRAGPILPLAIAAWTPFALLHYPAHLAVGLIPIALILAHLIASRGEPSSFQWQKAGISLASVCMVIAVAASWWQIRRVATDLWVGGNELRLVLTEQAAPEIRARMAAAVEAQILARIDRLPASAPTLWRTVGRARLVRGDAERAETAFRTAYDLWPHEDAEFYLGMSLVAQGRRAEGLSHLGRVCRTNPALVRLIGDPELRRVVGDMLEAYRRH
jgi:O-antigen ligase